MSDEIVVPETDARYLMENHQVQSVPEMAKSLRRAAATIYTWMAALKLPPKGRVVHRDHPFKVSNRKLETTLRGFRDANDHRKKFNS